MKRYTRGHWVPRIGPCTTESHEPLNSLEYGSAGDLEEGLDMDLRDLFLHDIERFVKGPSKSWVCEPKIGNVIIVIFKQTFLSGFNPWSGALGGRPLHQLCEHLVKIQ
jgi:hypothetical protein